MSKIDLETTNVFFNLTIANTQLINKGVPVRGGREKDSKFIGVFIKVLIKPRAIVLDTYASTCDCNLFLLMESFWDHIFCFVFGSLPINGVHYDFQRFFFHACKCTNRHLVIIKGDLPILDAILAPLYNVTPLVTCGNVPHITNLDLVRWWSNLVSISKFGIAFNT